jgi:hypothetical protein
LAATVLLLCQRQAALALVARKIHRLVIARHLDTDPSGYIVSGIVEIAGGTPAAHLKYFTSLHDIRRCTGTRSLNAKDLARLS